MLLPEVVSVTVITGPRAGGGAGLMVSGNETVVETPVESVTVSVTLEVAVVVGVPERTPLADSESPEGKFDPLHV